MLAKQVPYTMTKQVAFDFITSFLYQLLAAVRSATELSTATKIGITWGAGALTSVLSCIASQPGDVVLTETYKSHGKGGNASLSAICARIYKTEGLAGFFVGLNARLAHVGGIITSQLACYDYVKQTLGLAATGSH